MAYLRPGFITKTLAKPVAIWTGLYGSTQLTVAGRTSGEPRTVAVIPVEHEGARYLVSPRGETQWVRNLRAAGGGSLRYRGGPERPFRAYELPVAERPPVIAAYRKRAGRAMWLYWRKLPDPADHPVFRIDADR